MTQIKRLDLLFFTTFLMCIYLNPLNLVFFSINLCLQQDNGPKIITFYLLHYLFILVKRIMFQSDK